MPNGEAEGDWGHAARILREKSFVTGLYVLTFLSSLLGLTFWLLALWVPLYLSDLPTYPLTLILGGIILNGAYVRALYRQGRGFQIIRERTEAGRLLLIELLSLWVLNVGLVTLTEMLALPGYGDPYWRTPHSQ